MSISRNEWLNAVHEVMGQEDDPEALTLHEIMALIGKGRTATQDAIRKLVTTGAARKVQKRLIDNMGRVQYVPAYRLITPVRGVA